MEYKYGNKSTEVLHEACGDLQLVFDAALELGLIDITLLESHRGEAEQNRYFKIGKSKVEFPESKHNVFPSEGIDAAPYVNGKASMDWKHCIFLAGVVLSVAELLEIKVRWGGNWDMDGEPITDQDFQDLLHYEVVRE